MDIRIYGWMGTMVMSNCHTQAWSKPTIHQIVHVEIRDQFHVALAWIDGPALSTMFSGAVSSKYCASQTHSPEHEGLVGDGLTIGHRMASWIWKYGRRLTGLQYILTHFSWVETIGTIWWNWPVDTGESILIFEIASLKTRQTGWCDVFHPELQTSGIGIFGFGRFWDFGICDAGIWGPWQNQILWAASLSRFWPAGGLFSEQNRFLYAWIHILYNSDLLTSRNIRNLSGCCVHQLSAGNAWRRPKVCFVLYGSPQRPKQFSPFP